MQKPMFELLEGWLRHKSDMVNMEAARAICEMRNVTSQQLVRPISGKLCSAMPSTIPQANIHPIIQSFSYA